MRLSHPRISRTLLPTLVLSSLAALLAAPLMSNRHDAPKPPASGATNQAQPEQAREAYGRVPLSFEANQGQTDASVNFLARGAGYSLFLKPAEAVLVLRDADSESRIDECRSVFNPSSKQQSKVLRMKVVGADASAAAEGVGELAGKANYLVGDDPSKWRTDVPTYGRVRYAEVYRGVDLVYYGNQRQLEYDFHIAPGANARAVSLEFEGADKVEVDASGDLLLKLGESVIRQPKPFVYQEVAGARREVEAGYALDADGRVRFAVGEYDPAHTLVIDPVLVYSTYLGGSNGEQVNDIKVDSAGNAYLCGETASTNFPTANAIDATFNAGNAATDNDAFITKLNATGSALVYSTYLGGTGPDFNISGNDICRGIAVDSAGSAHAVGQTRSMNFPTANAIQATFGGGISEGFLAKLSPAGNALVYSTFIGGDDFDEMRAVALDSAGNVYVAGRSTSSNFATVNPIQATFKGGGSDATVSKINAAGNAFIYSTYLGGGGGNAFDAAFGIAVDSAGSAYVVGQTNSTDWPTASPIQATFGGNSTPGVGDAFVAKLNPAGNALAYSTYLGGGDDEIATDIAVDASGNAYVSGDTFSTNFPTANAFDSALGGTQDGFLTKLNPAGNAFVFSTYFGGSGGDACNGVGLDAAGNVYCAGGSNSTDLPTANATQAANGGGVDAFVSKLNAAGSALVYSTYLGGTGLDRANTLAVDSAGSVYVAGLTASTNFPTANPVQAPNGGGADGFVTKFADTTTTLQFTQATYPVQEDVTFVNVTVTRGGDTSTAVNVDYATADGTANERGDYTTALGTIRFAAGQTEAVVPVLISEDSFTEGAESFSVVLSNPTNGASLGAQATAAVQITDDAVEPTTNAIDDATVFVGMHYHDFLNRQADTAGLNFWRDQITACGSDAACIDRRRARVSQAFFLSIEYQQIGYYVFRHYKGTFTDSAARPRGMPRYREFLRDTQEIGRGIIVNEGNWEQQLAANRLEFTRRWVQRPDFVAQFPLSMSGDEFINKLAANLGATLSPSEFNIAIESYTQTVEGRALTLRNVVELNSVYNAQFNAAFVLSQYIGYLRRNPNDPPDADYTGFDFWLAKLNSFSLPGEDVRNEQTAIARVQRAEMVRAFILSTEYRGRFGQP